MLFLIVLGVLTSIASALLLWQWHVGAFVSLDAEQLAQRLRLELHWYRWALARHIAPEPVISARRAMRMLDDAVPGWDQSPSRYWVIQRFDPSMTVTPPWAFPPRPGMESLHG